MLLRPPVPGGSRYSGCWASVAVPVRAVAAAVGRAAAASGVGVEDDDGISVTTLGQHELDDGDQGQRQRYQQPPFGAPTPARGGAVWKPERGRRPCLPPRPMTRAIAPGPPSRRQYRVRCGRRSGPAAGGGPRVSDPAGERRSSTPCSWVVGTHACRPSAFRHDAGNRALLPLPTESWRG